MSIKKKCHRCGTECYGYLCMSCHKSGNSSKVGQVMKRRNKRRNKINGIRDKK